jgi:hypothetical protein
VATARRMTGRFEHFDARPGGSYRLVLAYADASVWLIAGRVRTDGWSAAASCARRRF